MGTSVRPEFDAVAFAREAQRRGMTMDDVIAELERRGATQYARELRSARTPGASLRSGAVEGILPVVGRPIMAAAGTAVQKLSGDDRPLGEIYDQLRADVETRERAAYDANPGLRDLGVFGGAMVQSIIPGVGQAARVLPGNQGTLGGRALQSGMLTGAQTGLQGFLNADGDLRAKLLEGSAYAGLGAAGGAAGSVLLEGLGKGIKGGYRLFTPRPVQQAVGDAAERVGGAVRKARDAALTAAGVGPQRPPIRVDPGAARVLNRLQAQEMSIPDLRSAANEVGETGILAEAIGEKGVRDLSTANILGNKAPEQIREALDERARDEATRWQRDLERLTKGRIRDPEAMMERVRQLARRRANKWYQRSAGLPVPDGAAASLLNRVETLRDDAGIDLWKLARSMDETFPKEPTEQLSVGELQRLREALDSFIRYNEKTLGTSTAERLAQNRLRGLRGEIDEVTKAAGGEAQVKGDAIYSTYLKRGEAFVAGATKAKSATTDEALRRLQRQTGQPEAFGRGVASMRLAEVDAMRDGMGGGIQNPFVPAMGSPTRRMVTRAAMPTDAAMEEAEMLAQQGQRRLATRNEVLGNSATARRTTDVAEAAAGMANPLDVAQAVANPVQGATNASRSLWDAVRRRALGDEMDQTVPYLLAGGTRSPYTRKEAIDRLEQMLPLLQSQWAQQVLRRGVVGGAAGRAATGSR